MSIDKAICQFCGACDEELKGCDARGYLKAAIEAEYVRIDDAAIEASVDIGCEIFHYVDIRLSKNDLENIERNALIHIRTRLQAILKELK